MLYPDLPVCHSQRKASSFDSQFRGTPRLNLADCDEQPLNKHCAALKNKFIYVYKLHRD